MPTTLIAFLGACTLVAASPGPSTVLIIKQSLHSRRSGFLTVLGNETGVFIWGVVAAFGLTALLTASEMAYDVMRIAGAVVLVGFGIQALRQARRAKGTEEDAEDAWEGTRKSGWASYRGGLLLNLANPKAAVFAMSFLPQFVPEGAPHLPAMIGLAALWAVYEVGYYGLYVWFVGRMKTVLSRAGVRRRLEQVSGGVLLLLGVRMAVDG
ncbi:MULTISPECIES: LysE family translocator [unclassified Streptomyces]|uniref:LysE family translocator n=1 Tax=unclassified Streptomyces TaxID=2593676 RepID=UPI0023650ED6|nr:MULTISPECIES: LysE family translocator [unclassified Streptomyces]MDF3144961.1 LysE family translocator [Streptomyces sp. T21Q-yed]WDF42183.1 LysE family translocator [Streptomyces sp. T12]